MKMLLASAALAAIVTAVPAVAQTYDARTGFTANADQSNAGVNNGNFIYGEYDPADLNTSGTFFASNTSCHIPGSTCLQASSSGPSTESLPGVYKNGQSFSSVIFPANALLLHPDDDSGITFAAFVAPTPGVYRLFTTFTVQDMSPTGVDIYRVGTTDGGLPLTSAYFGSLNAGTTTLSDFQLVTLGGSEAIGYGIGNAGSFNNDSTGLKFTVFAGVPEPTTWSLMILGFGAVGGALRRRAKVRTTVAFA